MNKEKLSTGDKYCLGEAYKAFDKWRYEHSPDTDFEMGLVGSAFLAGARWEAKNGLIKSIDIPPSKESKDD